MEVHVKFFELSLLCFIGRVNKPYLPIAAGDLSVQSAWLLVIFFAVTGLLIVGLNFGPFISSLYCLGLFLGTIYSVPPFRMKRFPVAAFLIIATVWLLFFLLIILISDGHTSLNSLISVRHKCQNT
jgi:4-hydroxybenzoate polyprenyltransferase